MRRMALAVCLLMVAAGNVMGEVVPQRVRMMSGENVVLNDSWLKEREALNTKYVMSLEVDRLLHNFRQTAGIPSVAKELGGWEHPGIGLRGHFVGHYMSAMSSLVERYHDPAAESRLCELVDGLAECQARFGNGYLGAFPERDFDTLERTFGNVWAPYYTLHKLMQGLVDSYLKTGNERALTVVRKAADYVCNRMEKLTPEQIEGILLTDKANPANEPGGMNEVMEQLYAITHVKRYLEVAKMFDREWFVEPLVTHRDNLSGLHSNTHIILIGGFVRRYENTGEERFRRASLNFWEMLTDGHVYANGSSSGPRPVVTTPTSRTAEHWGDSCRLAGTLSSEIAESCVTHNTQRLNNYLFQWTADARYANSALNTFYNATLACQNRKDGRVTYHLPLGSPRHKKWLGEEDFRCCNGSSIEAFASLNNNIYYVGDGSVYINNYVSSVMTWKEMGVTLTQRSEMPYMPNTDITVGCLNGSKRFALNILIPSWAEGTNVMVNGKRVKGMVRAGKFLTVNRKWKDGDKVRVTFQYDFYVKRMPDDEKMVVLFHGPLMLAFLSNEHIDIPATADEMLHAIVGSPREGYTLSCKGMQYRLMPLCDIVDEAYSCYVGTKNNGQ